MSWYVKSRMVDNPPQPSYTRAGPFKTREEAFKERDRLRDIDETKSPGWADEFWVSKESR